jgi:lipopolysaccharide export LptBFGC system permease protein LptF
MSVFEALMLVCFGAAWPFAVYRSWRSRSTGGKSAAFLYVIFAGYVFGTLHKILHSLDAVIWLYVANGLMVAADIALYHRNRRIERRKA